MEIDWRLPARLRRPVHRELERQRRKKRQREAIVQFKRRPLYPINQEPRAVPPPKANVGAEHHTGDVYRSSRPFLAASVPPYAGPFLRGKANPRQRVFKNKTAPPARVIKSAKPPVASRSIISGERDVPYQWATVQPASSVAGPASARVAPPRRRRFALPLHLSIWPFKNPAAEPASPAATTKKKVHKSDSLTSSFL